MDACNKYLQRMLAMHACNEYWQLPPPTGGAWTIGYKAWGAILARRLSERGMLVVCLDYRNYPQVRHCCGLICMFIVL